MKKPTRILATLHTGTALALAAALTLMVNYLAYRHYARADFSGRQFYTLSDKTHSLLNHLNKPVEIIVFFQPGHVLYEDIHNLLREYQYACDRLTIQWIDPDRDLAQTEELAARYEVTEANVAVFRTGARSKYVRADEIAEIDASKGDPRVTAFRGEQAFSSAIQSLSQETTPVVCFLAGHGERDPKDFDPRRGYSHVARLIERDNIELRKLLLSVEKKIPDTCDALIVAGAAQRMAQAEVDLIGAWLRRGGRLLVLSDAGQTSGLEELLANRGVILRDDVVYDPGRTLTGREVFVAAYGRHPITDKLGNTAAIFHLPRSVEPAYAGPGEDRPVIAALALSSETGWAETQPGQNPAQFDANTADLTGPVSMAVAVERGSPADRLDIQLPGERIVVFGDSDFASNGALSGGDLSLFMSALNWLLDREELMAIAPKPVDDTQLKLTRGKVNALFWITVGGIPATAGLLGFIIWLRRRK